MHTISSKQLMRILKLIRRKLISLFPDMSTFTLSSLLCRKTAVKESKFWEIVTIASQAWMTTKRMRNVLLKWDVT